MAPEYLAKEGEARDEIELLEVEYLVRGAAGKAAHDPAEDHDPGHRYGEPLKA